MLEGTGSQFRAAPARNSGRNIASKSIGRSRCPSQIRLSGFRVAVRPLGRQQSRGQRVEGRRESCDEGLSPVRCGTVKRAGERLALDPVVHDDIRPHALRRGGVEEEFRGAGTGCRRSLRDGGAGGCSISAGGRGRRAGCGRPPNCCPYGTRGGRRPCGRRRSLPACARPRELREPIRGIG